MTALSISRVLILSCLDFLRVGAASGCHPEMKGFANSAGIVVEKRRVRTRRKDQIANVFHAFVRARARVEICSLFPVSAFDFQIYVGYFNYFFFFFFFIRFTYPCYRVRLNCSPLSRILAARSYEISRNHRLLSMSFIAVVHASSSILFPVNVSRRKIEIRGRSRFFIAAFVLRSR